MPRIEVRALTDKPELRFVLVAVDVDPNFLGFRQIEDQIVNWKPMDDGSLQLDYEYFEQLQPELDAKFIRREYVQWMHTAKQLRPGAVVAKVELEVA